MRNGFAYCRCSILDCYIQNNRIYSYIIFIFLVSMRTQPFQTLVVIEQVGSFVKAAEELNSTLSTVSMQMKGLENQLGVELFDRGFRPPMLTPLGRKIAEQAKRLLGAEYELLRTCATGDELTGLFRLGFIATASVRLLPAFLKKAKDNAAKAEFQIETALSQVLEARVQSGQLDAAVVTASDKPLKGLKYTELRVEPLIFAVPAGFSDLPADKIATHLPFLQFSPGSGIGKLIENHIRDHFPNPEKTVILDSVEAIMECVNQGIGFTLLSEADARRYGSTDTQFLEKQSANPSRRLVLATPDRETGRHNQHSLVKLFA